ncbi:MAG: DUF134 domain-containing protein [Eubacteriales bacterium]|nr:DUF134 domain-containing protein [Eubacteriales bacterium]
MPRPRKWRMVCDLPRVNEFAPVNDRMLPREPVVMTVDEYETIRLIDNENLSQEECSVYMQIARTTVQQIYNNARKKVANALVNGLTLRIEGGDYRLCDGTEHHAGCGRCCRGQRGHCGRNREGNQNDCSDTNR